VAAEDEQEVNLTRAVQCFPVTTKGQVAGVKILGWPAGRRKEVCILYFLGGMEEQDEDGVSRK